jgi:hypothetical protein
MKTLNYILAAAMISFAIVSCQKDDIVPQKPSSHPIVVDKKDAKKVENASFKTIPAFNMIYSVTIHLKYEKPLHNNYVVRLTDGDNLDVAEPVNYDPNTSVYIFRELTNEPSAIRKASLEAVVYPGERFALLKEFNTEPAISLVEFKVNDTFAFDLYPKVTLIHNDPNNGDEMQKE